MKGINQAELEKKLDLVFQKLRIRGVRENEKGLRPAEKKLVFSAEILGLKSGTGPRE